MPPKIGRDKEGITKNYLAAIRKLTPEQLTFVKNARGNLIGRDLAKDLGIHEHHVYGVWGWMKANAGAAAPVATQEEGDAESSVSEEEEAAADSMAALRASVAASEKKRDEATHLFNEKIAAYMKAWGLATAQEAYDHVGLKMHNLKPFTGLRGSSYHRIQQLIDQVDSMPAPLPRAATPADEERNELQRVFHRKIAHYMKIWQLLHPRDAYRHIGLKMADGSMFYGLADSDNIRIKNLIEKIDSLGGPPVAPPSPLAGVLPFPAELLDTPASSSVSPVAQLADNIIDSAAASACAVPCTLHIAHHLSPAFTRALPYRRQVGEEKDAAVASAAAPARAPLHKRNSYKGDDEDDDAPAAKRSKAAEPDPPPPSPAEASASAPVPPPSPAEASASVAPPPPPLPMPQPPESSTDSVRAMIPRFDFECKNRLRIIQEERARVAALRAELKVAEEKAAADEAEAKKLIDVVSGIEDGEKRKAERHAKMDELKRQMEEEQRQLETDDAHQKLRLVAFAAFIGK